LYLYRRLEMKYIITAVILVLVVGIILLWGGFYGWLVVTAGAPPWLLILLGVIFGSLALTMVAVGIQRFKEQRSGEEDDLSQY